MGDDAYELKIGTMPPDWVWAALDAGKITVTNAKIGEINTWGRDGIDVQGADGPVHIPLGGVLRRSDVA